MSSLFIILDPLFLIFFLCILCGESLRMNNFIANDCLTVIILNMTIKSLKLETEDMVEAKTFKDMRNFLSKEQAAENFKNVCRVTCGKKSCTVTNHQFFGRHKIQDVCSHPAQS